MLLLSCKDKKANLFIRNTPNKKILPAHAADRIFYFTYPVPDTYCADSYTPAQSPS